MPKLFVNDIGTVREVTKLFANDSGTVREITKLWALDGTTPRLVYPRMISVPPTPASFPTSPNLLSALASTTVDLSGIAADTFILGHLVGGGGGGAESNGDPDAEAGGGGGGGTIFLVPRSDFSGNTLTLTAVSYTHLTLPTKA